MFKVTGTTVQLLPKICPSATTVPVADIEALPDQIALALAVTFENVTILALASAVNPPNAVTLAVPDIEPVQ